jgi:hypothetical protein
MPDGRVSSPLHRRDPLMRPSGLGRHGLVCTLSLLLGLGSACGSSNSGPVPKAIAAPADNVAEVSIDYGLPESPYVNGLFATITVCVPGTSDCQSIDHVLVDTGSSGLRLLATVLTLSLPTWMDDNGVALAECNQFVDSFVWGELRTVDLSIAGELASGLPIQVIGESTYPVPNDCTGADASNVEALGANGLLGVAAFLQDCGPACAAGLGPKSENPGMYYECSSAAAGGCQAAAVPVSEQVSNPAAFFSQDNNGTIVELPAISADGAPSVTGALVFGIGTRANNGLDGAAVLRLDSYGEFLTRYPSNGGEVAAFIDSGSNAIFFLDSGTTGIPTCSDSAYSDFYCPNSTLNLSVQLQDTYGSTPVTANFSVANAEGLFAANNYSNVAFDDLGGPSAAPQPGTTDMGTYFDWGLPFHFGRNVFTAIEGQATSSGAGPFVAF